MARIGSVSESELTQRRQMLRNHRRLKLLQSGLRTLAVGGMAAGLVWATTRPIWVLRESNQISIEGNQFLSGQVLRSLIPLSYPQSLLRIQPEVITRSLESQATIDEATVTRQLFPPGLRIKIKERLPVAIALTKLPAGNSTPNPKAEVGLLDHNGVWIPLQTYISQSTTSKLPNLKVIGLPEQYRPYWTQLYQAVSRSPIKVIEINCQDPANLILKTELGIVHFGAYSPRLTEQLQVLDKLRKLPAQLNSNQIAYIDLKNPETPLVQMNHSKEVVKPEQL